MRSSPRRWETIAPFARMAEQRFWSRVQKGDGCWPWLGAKNRKGYGSITLAGLGGVVSTHRLSYGLSKGGIPDGMWVLHHCDNPICCNPDHLFLGTNAENMRDAFAKGRKSIPRGPGGTLPLSLPKEFCAHGHEMTPENAPKRATKGRRCRECERARTQRRRKSQDAVRAA